MFFAPVRATLAWVDHNVLPRAGGVLQQPYALWRAIELVGQGLAAARESRAKLERQALMAALNRPRM